MNLDDDIQWDLFWVVVYTTSPSQINFAARFSKNVFAHSIFLFSFVAVSNYKIVTSILSDIFDSLDERMSWIKYDANLVNHVQVLRYDPK